MVLSDIKLSTCPYLTQKIYAGRNSEVACLPHILSGEDRVCTVSDTHSVVCYDYNENTGRWIQEFHDSIKEYGEQNHLSTTVRVECDLHCCHYCV